MKPIESPPTDLAGYNPLRNTAGCSWDGAAAARAVGFFADVLTHPDDSPYTKAGDAFTLRQWQADYVATLYGWKRPNGMRRYTESLAGIPRKQGKSVLASGLLLYELRASGRRGAQIYSAAQTRDQAGLVYSMAAAMVRHSPFLSRTMEPLDSHKRIVYKDAGSFYRALPAEAGPVHGTKPAVVIFDELHTQKNRDLYDALKTGQGATSDPLFLSITTAGFDRHSICFEVWNRARQVRDGIIDDPYFLPLLYELGDDEPWDNEATWARCNPNLGHTVSLDFLREHYQQAKQSPAYENTFRNLYLNQWVENEVRWISMDAWDESSGELADLSSRPCWGGLDLASTTDLAAFVLVFPDDDGTYDVLPVFWVPEENIRKRARKDGVPYEIWAKQNFLRPTPGNAIDFDQIRADIIELGKQFNIQQIAVDRWNATQITTQLTGDGFEMVLFGQGFASMSSPSKAMETLVLEKKLRHAGHPVLRWNAANVAAEQDAAGNIKPSKAKSTERIDGITALVMALGVAQASPVDGPSIYSTPGSLLL